MDLLKIAKGPVSDSPTVDLEGCCGRGLFSGPDPGIIIKKPGISPLSRAILRRDSQETNIKKPANDRGVGRATILGWEGRGWFPDTPRTRSGIPDPPGERGGPDRTKKYTNRVVYLNDGIESDAADGRKVQYCRRGGPGNFLSRPQSIVARRFSIFRITSSAFFTADRASVSGIVPARSYTDPWRLRRIRSKTSASVLSR